MNKDYLTYIEQNLTKVLVDNKDKYPEKLYKAMEYGVFSGGKRVRPYLMLLTADFLDIPHSKVISQAVSLELIHSYSLIHDDLPDMDNDNFRREKPTCHKVFGAAIAILAGDALLNLAYENLLKASLFDTSLLKSCYYIALNSGGIGMIGGQALEFSNLEMDLPLYEKICAKKTGALITSAVFSPAFIKSNEKEFEALQAFGGCLGLIFQLVDDILDIDKDKTSFVKFTNKELVYDKLNKINTDAIKIMTPFKEKGEKLIEFCNYLTNRTI